MKKIIIIGILSVIVLILSILGIVKYSENNSINIGFGIGNSGIGTNINEGRTKKGSFLKCEEYQDTLLITKYFDLSDGTLNRIMQYKAEGDIPADYVKKYSKSELNGELLELLCANDKDKALCGNVKIKWNNNHVIMTFAVDLNSYYNKVIEGINEAELMNQINKSNTKCEKVVNSPIYSTIIDPAGTYYNIIKKHYNNYKIENKEQEKQPVENKKTPTTINSVNKVCKELSTGNYNDIRSEGISFIFYCNKKVINPTINVNITKRVDSTNSSFENSKKYLKEKYCDKYHFSNCTYTKIEGGIKLVAECKTNYNGLDPNDIEQLYDIGQNIDQAMNSVCKQ